MAWANPTPNELAADWIASRRRDADEAAGSWAQFLLVDFPREEPELTWEAIKIIVRGYPEDDFYAETETEAQVVCGVLSAGPVEDLLSFHGPDYINRFEQEAARDRRMAWILGGAWQAQMRDDVWNRVQLAADKTYWRRRVPE